MSAHDDELNDFLDDLVLGRASAPPGGDAGLARAATRFLAPPGPEPRPGFAAGLEQTLMNQGSPLSVSANGRGTVAHDRALQPAVWPFPRHRGRAWALACALAAVALLTVAAVGDLARRGSGPASIVAPAVLASPSDAPASPRDCITDPVTAATIQAHLTDTYVELTRTLPLSMRTAPSALHQAIDIVAESDLPAGPAPDAATRAAVLQRLRAEVSCHNAALLASQSGVGTPVTEGTRSLAPITVPAVLRMTVLPDGRVGVLLASDLFGNGCELYFTFAPYGGSWGEWVGDSMLLVMPDAWLLATAPAPPAAPFPITAYDVYIAPPLERVVAAGQDAVIRVANKGEHTHTFAIASLGLAVTIQPNGVADVPLAVPPGGYTYHIDIDDPTATPAVGKIWVVAASSAAGAPAATP